MRRPALAAASLGVAILAAAPAAADMIVTMKNDASLDGAGFGLGPLTGTLNHNSQVQLPSTTPGTPVNFRFQYGGENVCLGRVSFAVQGTVSTCAVEWTLFSPRCYDTFGGSGTATCTVTITFAQ